MLMLSTTSSSLFLLILSLLLPCGTQCYGSSDPHFLSARPSVLNLMHHPLQLQLATSELPLGSFRRLCRDRRVILEGLQRAAPPGLLDGECGSHDDDAETWLAAAEAAGKSIDAGLSSIAGSDILMHAALPHAYAA